MCVSKYFQWLKIRQYETITFLGSTSFATTHVFADGTWTQVNDLPQPRRQHKAVSVSGTEIFFCGGAHQGVEQECWLYDYPTDSYTAKASLNELKWGVTMAMALKADGTKWVPCHVKLWGN